MTNARERLPAGPPAQGKLVGRTDELARLDDALQRLRRGEPGALAFTGEPGIGKTALLTEARTRAEAAATLVLSGRAGQFETEIPFGVFVDALDDYLGTLNPRFDSLEAHERVELARVFPSLRELEGELPLALESERYRAHRAVRRLLELLASRKPVVLVLDDLHWADDASQELISFLLRRPLREPVLLALAYRPGEAAPSLALPVGRAIAEGTCDRIELGPLNRDESREMTGSAGGLDDLLYTESGGNPFYLEQLARSAPDERGRRTDPSLELAEAPPAVLGSLVHELAELDQGARTLLECGAVVGDPFDLDLAIAASELDEQEALAALDTLLRRELVRVGQSPRRFRFRHPIVRHAVYASASASLRLQVHATVAALLDERGASVTERARHVERSASVGDEAAIRVLAEAGETASARAPATAAHWFGAALRLLPSQEEHGQRRLELLIPRATALAASGHRRESRDALIEILNLIPESAVAERVPIVAACASVEHLMGLHEAAGERLRAALADLPATNSSEAAALWTQVATNAAFRSDFAAMRDASATALKIAREAGDQLAVATAAALLAQGRRYLGDVSGAIPEVDAAAAIVDGLTDESLQRGLDALFWLGWAEYFTDRFEGSLRHFERALTISRATGQGYLIVFLLVGQADALVALGRLRDAASVTESALDAARVAGDPEVVSWSLLAGCWVSSRTGELKTAVALADEAAELIQGLEASVASASAGWITGAARLEAGDPEGCARAVLEYSGGDDLGLIEPSCRVFGFELLVRSELAAGRIKQAGAWARRAEQAAQQIPLPLARTWACRARAALELAQDDSAAAAARALEAAESAAGAGAQVEAARSRVLAGRALVLAGDQRRGCEELERARAVLDACGAIRFRDEASRELRKLGRRVPTPGRRGAGEAGVGALSGREHEIASLVAEGKSNKEIAAGLHLSVRTVENHLRRVFAKLDVTRRGAIGSKLAEASESVAVREAGRA